MRFLIILTFIITLPLYGETLFFNSNRSGMYLEEIDSPLNREYYIEQISDFDLGSVEEFFYTDGELTKSIKYNYTLDMTELLESEELVDGIKTRSIYRNGRLSSVTKYQKEELLDSQLYHYSSSNLLEKIEYHFPDESRTFSDLYYRNKDGSLRKLYRTGDNGYIIQWYYIDGVIHETWFSYGEKKEQTLYNTDGLISQKINYSGEKEKSKETFNYSITGMLLSSEKIEGEIREEKLFDSDGKNSELRRFKNDILVVKKNFIYQNGYLTKESISGHGKKEVLFYYRDSNNELSNIKYFLNGQLKRESILDSSNDSELIEYFREDELYLKEFYTHGERVLKELYLDGVLFKSESISE